MVAFRAWSGLRYTRMENLLNHAMVGKLGPGDLLRTAVDRIRLLVIVLVGVVASDGRVAASDDPSNVPDFGAEDRAYWAFQPIRRPESPRVRNAAWCRNPVDAFIMARLEGSGLEPAGEADKLTLLRRVKLDLHGLPPTLAEQERFLADDSPGAYGHLIDRLLASPRYGERWARHWLDLARYAESHGFYSDRERTEAWRYRDWVVRSLNEDKSYDRFVREQLAGDEVFPANLDALVATGFLRHWPYSENFQDTFRQREVILADITDVVGQVFLGLTFGCARCHDHKSDPILQRDYYRLQAFFAPLDLLAKQPLGTPAALSKVQKQERQWAQATREIRAEIERIEGPHYQKEFRRVLRTVFPEGVRQAHFTPEAQRTELQKHIVALSHPPVVSRLAQDRIKKGLQPAEQERLEALRAKLEKHEPTRRLSLPVALAVRDLNPAPPPTYVPGVENPQDILPGPLSILDARAAKIEPIPQRPDTSGRRTALSRWITRSGRPLTARVMVNRLWHYHFGRGIVATPSDFGRQGERPTHPKLLDYLAAEFVANGGSLKAMHRLMLTSATFRQISRHPAGPTAHRVDPENRLLWRMRRHRLEAEALRDAMLVVSGELNLRMGGPSVKPELPPAVRKDSFSWKPTQDPVERARRSIYMFVRRGLRHPLMEAFDMPDTHISCDRRSLTTTPLQALTLLNDKWTLDRARAFAGGVLREAGCEPRDQVASVFRQAFCRPPTADEVSAAVAFLHAHGQVMDERLNAKESVPLPEFLPEGLEPARAAAFVDFCHVVFNANEFLYVQ